MYFDDGTKNEEEIVSTGLYKELEIPNGSNSDVIRKAYRKLALKHHPDKGGEVEKFQKLQNAYEILSDPDQKEIYDKYGEEGLKKGGESFNNSSNLKKRKAPASLYTIRVSLEEIYTGSTRELEITRDKFCKTCKGTGSKTGLSTNCTICQGTGYKAVLLNTNFGLMQSKELCSGCSGTGSTLKESDRCTDCKGTQINSEKATIKVDIDKGAPDGCRYKFVGEGNDKVNYETGDVHVELFFENKTMYQRKGADLFTTLDISIVDAFSENFEYKLKHLDGRFIFIKSKTKEVVQPGSIKCLKDCGLPFYKSPYKYGNMYISFNIVMPTLEKQLQDKVSECFAEEKKLLEKMYLESKEQKGKITRVTMMPFDNKYVNSNESGGKKVERKVEEDDGEETYKYSKRGGRGGNSGFRGGSRGGHNVIYCQNQ